MKYNIVVGYVKEILSQYDTKLTLRQTFYRLVANYGLVNKRGSYNTLSKQLVKARKQEDIPIDSIIDRSRNIIPSGDDDDGKPEDYFKRIKGWLHNDCAKQYSLSMWKPQDHRIEVWVEKDALSEVIGQITKRFNVLTAPSRGYSSFSYILDATKRFPDKENVVLLFTDHDPSGIDMERDLQKRLDEDSSFPITVKRLGLTYDQVQKYDLSPNRTKKTDTRSKSYEKLYGNDCWELDALPPDVLQKLVEDNIRKYIDVYKWNNQLKAIEKGRKKVQKLIDEFLG